MVNISLTCFKFIPQHISVSAGLSVVFCLFSIVHFLQPSSVKFAPHQTKSYDASDSEPSAKKLGSYVATAVILSLHSAAICFQNELCTEDDMMYIL